MSTGQRLGEPLRRSFAGPLAIALIVPVLAGACASTQVVRATRYELEVPEFWQVKAVGKADGEPTLIRIGQYGEAVIDQGSGTVAPQGMNYDIVTAEVEARIYGWPARDPDRVSGARAARTGIDRDGSAPAAAALPAEEEVFAHLHQDPELDLSRHLRVPETPFECNRFPRKYRFLGTALQPIDLVRRPGHRAIVVGIRGRGNLLGIVARVEFEPDIRRYCHNLNNLQLQLQTLLDGLRWPGAAPVD